VLIEKINEQIMKWEGVTSDVHRFGGIEFRIGNREMGLVHGDKLADFPFPMQIRNTLVESGRASPHHILPQSGWKAAIEIINTMQEKFIQTSLGSIFAFNSI
jgi:hypothetical protein